MKLRTALIGLGNIGSQYDQGVRSKSPRTHVGAILQSRGFELCAVFDSSATARRQFQKDWKQDIPVFSSLSALLKSQAFDVITLASSTQSHFSILKSVITQSPQLIFCEKPFCKTFTEAKKIARAADQAQIPILVNYHRRWDPRFDQFKKILSSSGTPIKVIVTYQKGLVNYGSHAIDLLMNLFGPIHSVFPTPSLSAQIRFVSGFDAHLIAVEGTQYDLFEFEFYFKNRKIEIVYGGEEFHSYSAKPNLWYKGYTCLSQKPKRWTAPRSSPLLRAYSEISAFLNRQAPLPKSNASSALKVHQVIDQIQRGQA